MTDNRIPDNVDPGFTGGRMAEFFDGVTKDMAETFGLNDPEVETKASADWAPEGVEPPAEDEITERDVLDPEVEQARQEPVSGDEDLDPGLPEDRVYEDRSEAHTAAPRHTATLLVIGSADWEDDVVVGAALTEWLNRHHDHDLIVATTGCPVGAEARAAEIAQAYGAQIATIRAEQIVAGIFASGLAFIRNGSAGANVVLERAAAAGIGIEVFRRDSIAAKGAWVGY